MDTLLIIAIIWLAAASFTDLKKREVANWLSFSLIAIALAVRASESIIAGNAQPILTSVIGLAIFFVIANVLYFGKIFAGGDAKLLMAMGAVIPGAAFLSNFLIIGGVYGLIYSFGLAIIHRKAFSSGLKKINKKTSCLMIFIFAVFILGLILKIPIIYIITATIILIYYLHVFVKTVEKSCLIRKVSPQKLTEGDWLFKDIKIRGKTLKASFHGLTQKQINLIKKNKKLVQIKYGIPFIPVFLIAFLLTYYFDNILLLFI